MNDGNDQQLLRDYVQHRSEAAFAELVRRHLDFVYSTAMRLVGNPQSAEDVAQGVFVALAQNAARLAEHPILSGWLHCTTRNLAAKSVRANVRRTTREQEAAAMNELLAGSNALWDSLAPHLDEALGQLAATDRDVLLLRFFERKSAREMAQILGTSEEAAQKRLSRAVERLREFFSKRGIAIGTTGIVLAFSAHAVQAAPAGLATTISTSALVAGAAMPTSTTITATKVILMTTAQKTLFGLAIAVALTSPLVTQFRAEAHVRDQQEALRRGADVLARLQTDNSHISPPAATLRNASDPQTEQWYEVLKLRGEITGLQSEIQKISDAKTDAPLTREEKLASLREYYSERIQRLKDLLAANPSQQVPELKYLPEDKWLRLMETYGDGHTTDPDNSHLMSLARRAAQIEFGEQNLRPALLKYLEQNGGQFPTELSQLMPYFTMPLDASILQNWTILPVTSLPKGLRIAGDWAITQKAPVNAAIDGRFVFNEKSERIENDPTKAWVPADGQP
ncbi:MAG TPA: sigma-70 family RNA polymerase sigma factor [Verrucomicrobiae bacterium]|nr:sigma-70 family RNA polymerase sigma factor [Verrucomicrobiae bacterium]